MRTQLSSNSASTAQWTPATMAAYSDESQECHVRFPPSTLPKHMRGTFLLSTEYRLLRRLGEVPPFSTRLFLRIQSKLEELEPITWCWGDDISTICLTAIGPHAPEVCSLLPGLVENVLSTTTFDQDGFVVSQ
jgi:hypothetical protein